MSADRAGVEGMVSTAETALAKATTDLEGARQRLTEVEAQHDEHGTTATRKAVVDARVDVESAERVHTKRTKALESARAGLRRLVREERASRLLDLQATLSALPGLVSQHGERLLALDREVHAAVLAIVGHVADGQRAFDEAKGLADELGESARFDRDFTRPTVADQRLSCSRYVTSSRLAETPPRPAVAPSWLADASHDLRWERVAADATELAARDTAARQAEDLAARQGQAQREAHLVTTTAALVAAANVTPTTPTDGAAT